MQNRLTIAVRSDASTIDTGSSATSSAGLAISARAIATRCNWPPDISCGKRPCTSASDRPTWTQRGIGGAARGRIVGRAGDFARGQEQVTFEPLHRIEGLERVLEDRLHLAHEVQALPAPVQAGDVGPLKRMRPALGRTVARIMRASVVLPLPDSPMIARISGRWAASSKLTSSTARVLRPNKPPLA